jgi:hypothetical protein
MISTRSDFRLEREGEDRRWQSWVQKSRFSGGKAKGEDARSVEIL